MASALPGVTSNIVSTPTTAPPANSSSGSGTAIDKDTLASNFTSFLSLLTTQLQNQNPLDPMDTNQFTQQLVQFSQVEQQLKSNDQLASLVTLQQAQQATQSLAFVGTTVAVDGSTAKLANGHADWSFNLPKAGTANVKVTNAAGQTVYSGTFSGESGLQNFTWDGHDKSGKVWPDGNYSLSVTATDVDGNTSAVSTEINGMVDSVDLTKNPPVLSIGGQDFTVDKVKRVTRPLVQQPDPPPDSGSDGSGSNGSGSNVDVKA